MVRPASRQANKQAVSWQWRNRAKKNNEIQKSKIKYDTKKLYIRASFLFLCRFTIKVYDSLHITLYKRYRQQRYRFAFVAILSLIKTFVYRWVCRYRRLIPLGTMWWWWCLFVTLKAIMDLLLMLLGRLAWIVIKIRIIIMNEWLKLSDCQQSKQNTTVEKNYIN